MKFIEAVRIGNLPALRQICATMHPKTIKECVWSKYYRCFRLAAARGYLDILRYLVELDLKPAEVSKQTGYIAARMAAANGHLAILQYLEEIGLDMVAAIEFKGYNMYLVAAGNGHLEVLQYLDKIRTISNLIGIHILMKASRNSNIQVIEFLIKKTNIASQISSMHTLCLNAVTNRLTNVLDYLSTLIKMPDFVRIHRRTILIWAINKDLSILKYFIKYPEFDIENLLSGWDPYLLTLIIQSGHTHFLEYCINHLDKTEFDIIGQLKIYKREFINTCILNGHVAMLQYFEKLGINIFEYISPKLNGYLINACKHGDLEMAQYLIDGTPEKLPLDLFKKAVAGRHIGIIEYLCKIYKLNDPAIQIAQLIMDAQIEILRDIGNNSFIYCIMMLENRYATPEYISVFSGISHMGYTKWPPILCRENQIDIGLHQKRRLLKSRILRLVAWLPQFRPAAIRAELYSYIHYPIICSNIDPFSKRLHDAVSNTRCRAAQAFRPPGRIQ